MLTEVDKHYGEGIINEYSKKLTKEIGSGYTYAALTRMKKFYFLITNLATVSQLLSYSHYVELLPFDDLDKIEYYIQIVEQRKLSVRQLRERIKSKEYERLDDETKLKLINKEDTTLTYLVPNPIIIKSSNIKDKEHIKEYVLKETILTDLDNFLSQLGTGYTYVSNEYK